MKQSLLAPSAEKENRAWQRMLSGRRLDMLNPSPLDIEIEDIAHGLARVARWNGQTAGEHALSVAQHSIYVEEVVTMLRPHWPAQWRLAALLHDSPEYVVGDLITPFKSAVGSYFKTIEQRLLEAIHIRFGLPGRLPEHVMRQIKRADKIMAYYEAVRLAGFSEKEARRFFGGPRGLSQAEKERLAHLRPWPVNIAQKRFLTRFAALTDDRPASATA